MRLPSGETLLDRGIDHDLAMEVIRYCRAADIHVHAYRDDLLFSETDRPEVRAYAANAAMEIHVAPDIDSALGQTTPKLVVVAERRRVENLLPEFRERWRGRLFVTTSQPTYLEMTRPDADKRQALEFVARRLDIDPADAVAAGDGRNDIPMLRWAGVAVAVEGAPEEVVQVADRVIPPPGKAGIAKLVGELLAP